LIAMPAHSWDVGLVVVLREDWLWLGRRRLGRLHNRNMGAVRID